MNRGDFGLPCFLRLCLRVLVILPTFVLLEDKHEHSYV